jgi:hypothetical protein
MKRDEKDRAEKLIDIGSTTALSAMVEIVSNDQPAGILVRQAQAMLDRLERPEDQVYVLEGFHDELQSFIESVPGARRATLPQRQNVTRKGRTA